MVRFFFSFLSHLIFKWLFYQSSDQLPEQPFLTLTLSHEFTRIDTLGDFFYFLLCFSFSFPILVFFRSYFGLFLFLLAWMLRSCSLFRFRRLEDMFWGAFFSCHMYPPVLHALLPFISSMPFYSKALNHSEENLLSRVLKLKGNDIFVSGISVPGQLASVNLW